MLARLLYHDFEPTYMYMLPERTRALEKKNHLRLFLYNQLGEKIAMRKNVQHKTLPGKNQENYRT